VRDAFLSPMPMRLKSPASTRPDKLVKKATIVVTPAIMKQARAAASQAERAFGADDKSGMKNSFHLEVDFGVDLESPRVSI
jgi:hypothetical protein